MTIDNLILINGGSYNDIKKALRQWIDLYSNDLLEGLTFELYKNGRGNHFIKADKRLDNERFFYLINYLKYPEGIEYKIDIEGFTRGKDNNKLKNKELLVYISPTDKEYDNVFVTTSENDNYKVDFGGRIIPARDKKSFVLPNELSFEKPELLTVNQAEKTRENEKVNENNLEKRFKVLSLIALGLMAISIVVLYYDMKAFIKFTFFLGIGLGAWFFGDYKMLQSNKFYGYSLFISLGFLAYTAFIQKEINLHIELVDLGAFYPLTLLIIQKPTRLIFKSLLNREPIIDRPPPSFWDGVYMIILFMGFAVIPFIIMDKLN